MSDLTPHPVVLQFIAECSAAQIDPETVMREARVHRATWFRWKAGRFTPSMTRWDSVQDALDRVKQARAA